MSLRSHNVVMDRVLVIIISKAFFGTYISVCFKKTMAFFQLEEDITKMLEDHIDPKIISKYLSYVITGSIYSEYNKGLETTLKIDCPPKDNHGLVNLLSKMILKYGKTPMITQEPLIVPVPCFNLTFKNQQKLHPAIDFLYSCVLPFHYDKSETILDLYVDDTFGPNQKVYELLKIVPYTNNWYGFIYNTVTFDNVFIDSLAYCKGLFVFSERMKKSLENQLKKRNLDIEVSLFCFPVEDPVKLFNGSDISGIVSKNSLEKSNVFSFYNKKFILKEEFWIKPTKKQQLTKYLLEPVDGPVLSDINMLATSLKPTDWNTGLVAHISRLTSSVSVLDHYDLDQLLSNNLVYCNVVSGSVVWILNECIVRNTPVVINKNPIVVELLGPDYPLYLDNNSCEITITKGQVKEAHSYLKKLNKSKFSVTTFLCALSSKIKN